jgi:hypothetical protein
MKARSLALSLAAVGSLALFVTPAEAGGCRKHHRHHGDNCYGGGWNNGYYQRAYYAPRCYQPDRYLPAPLFAPPAFQIGFLFGGSNGYGRCR